MHLELTELSLPLLLSAKIMVSAPMPSLNILSFETKSIWPGWSGTSYVAQVGLEPHIFMPYTQTLVFQAQTTTTYGSQMALVPFLVVRSTPGCPREMLLSRLISHLQLSPG